MNGENLKIFLLSILLVFLTNSSLFAYTVIGCVSDDTGFLYTGSAGINSPRPGGYGPVYELSPVITSGEIGTGIYCSPVELGNCVIRTKSKCTKCTGPYDYNSSWWGTDYYYEQAGKLKGFMECPIDDYIPLLLVSMTGFSVYCLRQRCLVG